MVKKGKKNIFGYKGFITTDATYGYIKSIQVTAANVSEVTNLEPALSGVNKMGMKVLYTDKGYASASNVEWLETNGIGNGITGLQHSHSLIYRVFIHHCRDVSIVPALSKNSFYGNSVL